MHLRAKRPVFVPADFFKEMDELTKSTLMDMVWDLAKQCTPPDDDGNEAPATDVMGTVRHIADVVSTYRKQTA